MILVCRTPARYRLPRSRICSASHEWSPTVSCQMLLLVIEGAAEANPAVIVSSVWAHCSVVASLLVQVMLHAPLLRSFYLGEGHDPGSCRLTARDKPCLSCQLVRGAGDRQGPWGPGSPGPGLEGVGV